MTGRGTADRLHAEAVEWVKQAEPGRKCWAVDMHKYVSVDTTQRAWSEH